MTQPEPVAWRDGAPHSDRFGDVYRTRYNATAQARTVFLHGCGLPGRWQQRAHFTLLETGFGLGLNFLTTWAAWAADPQRCNQLHYVAIEAYPVGCADLLRSVEALEDATPEPDPTLATLQTLARQLATVWADLRPGVNRWAWADGHLTLELHVADVQTALASIDTRFDAVYLDGFSPALNPEMWSDATLTAVAQLCQPGTVLATYTVAGAVRRRLTALGFEVSRCAGLPPKRERLRAVMPALKSADGPDGQASDAF